MLTTAAAPNRSGGKSSMIELWDGYAIASDDYQFILGKPTTRTHKQRGREEQYMEDASYHATLTQAIATFHRIQLREYTRNDTRTLAQAVTASAQIENRIRQLIPEPEFNPHGA